MSLNLNALDALPAASKTPGIPAYLLKADGSRLTFLYNPQEKSLSTTANYSEAPTFGVSVPDQVFQHGSGRTLELSNLLVDTFSAGKNLQPLIDSYVGLTKLRDEVRFVWGSNTFGPAVVTSVNWQETKWLDGQPAFGVVNLSLLEVPSLVPESTVPVPTSAPDVDLTQRQIDTGSTKATRFLNQNAFKLRDVLTSSNNDPVTVSARGVVQRGQELIGSWNGLDFTPEKRLQ